MRVGEVLEKKEGIESLSNNPSGSLGVHKWVNLHQSCAYREKRLLPEKPVMALVLLLLLTMLATVSSVLG